MPLRQNWNQRWSFRSTRDNVEHAMAWFQADYQVMMACIALAAGQGFDSHGRLSPWVLGHFQGRQDRLEDLVSSQYHEAIHHFQRGFILDRER